MDKITKLLKKISANDRKRLLNVLSSLSAGSTNLNIIKLKGSDLLRLRTGRFRIIFHYQAGEPVILSIKIRNEKTYNNL